MRQFSNWSLETQNKILKLWHAGLTSAEIVNKLDLPEKRPTPTKARVAIFIARMRKQGHPLATRRQLQYVRFK